MTHPQAYGYLGLNQEYARERAIDTLLQFINATPWSPPFRPRLITDGGRVVADVWVCVSGTDRRNARDRQQSIVQVKVGEEPKVFDANEVAIRQQQLESTAKFGRGRSR